MEPTAQEQLMLELVNRARLDPAGEAKMFGIDLNKGLGKGTIKATPKQPLAMNMDLLEAARAHSAWMLDKDVFSHTGVGGSSAGDRMADAGYVFTGNWAWGENIAWQGTTGSLNLTSYIVDQHKALFKSPGHRENILDGDFREIGVGQIQGDFKGYNASMVSQEYAASGNAMRFVTGVMYDDKDGNDFYSVGEGKGGIAVSLGGTTTASMSAGGYQVKAPTGLVTVTFDGDIVFKVDTKQGNAKVDLVDGSTLESSASLTIVDGIQHARLLGIAKTNLTGGNDDDRLDGNAGKNKMWGNGGDDTLNGGRGRDKLFGDNGDDKLVGNGGKDKLLGGAGDDILKGGNGRDTFVFKQDVGDDRVLGFKTGKDRLDFRDIFGSAKKALAAADTDHGNTVFDLPGGDHVTLKGVKASSLSVDDFV